jgi:hypothetical protein
MTRKKDGKKKERLEELGRTNDLILYPVATKKEARRHAPPDVLALCQETRCCVCRVAVMPLKDTLVRTRALARRVGRRLAVLCSACCDELTLKNPRPLVHLEQEEPEIRAALRQHYFDKHGGPADMELKDSVALHRRLGTAIDRRTHWVFIAACEEGRDLVRCFQAGLVEKGPFLAEAFGNLDDIFYGNFEFTNMPTRDHALVSFVAVPKRHMDQDQVNALLEHMGGTGGRTDGRQDFILLGEEPANQRVLQMFLQTALDGTCRAAPADN